MDSTLVASVVAPLVGWFIVGGSEKLRQERTLWLLEVAERLGVECATAKEARKVAEAEVSRFLERRGTSGWQAVWIACGIGASLAALVLLAGAFVGREAGTRVGSGVVGVMYIGMAVWAFRHLGEVAKMRKRQRPTSLVLPWSAD